MCNSIFIGDKTLPKAKDGEEFEVTIKGVYHIEDGTRKLDVLEVDGKDVADPEECGCGEDPLMDSNDAVTIYFTKPKKE